MQRLGLSAGEDQLDGILREVKAQATDLKRFLTDDEFRGIVRQRSTRS